MAFLSYIVDRQSAFFLLCFCIGLLASVGSFLLSGHGHMQAGHSSVHLGHGHVSGHLHGHANHGSTEEGMQSGFHLSEIINLNTVLAFLLGFGAVGFIFTQLHVLFILVVFLASIGGLAFGYIVYSVLFKVLLRKQSPYLEQADFNIVGLEGTADATMMANKMGEVSYILRGSYGFVPARSQDNQEIKKGEPVVITEFSYGVATVMKLNDFRQLYQNKEE